MIVVLFGCEAQNPICTDNFCVVGEVFPRSELDANQEFSKVEIDDSVIFATLATATLTTPAEKTTPAEPAPTGATPGNGITKTTIASIVSDTLAGRYTF